ncbi:hypothetical protein [Cryptosporangium sp. NPDC051539]|uniref:hypothetical protein n=1 Tax=Cryptosporangium sp. NPDC051539 TaxID=3363962 RepID=UPI0037AD2CFA
MTTAPHRSRSLAGARPVFTVRAPGPGCSRPIAVAALLEAVRAVIGVRAAELRTSADGDRTLHLELVEGADETAVAWSVTRILDERLGVEVDQTRSVLVDDSVDETRSVPLDGPQRRVHLERLQVVTGGLDVRVDVALATAGARVVGSASGPAVERTVLRTVAGATLNAVDALLEGRARCGLDQAELTDIGSDKLAIAVVTLLTPGQVDRLAGAALVRGDARQAMVRAVLSALNRRFESLVPERGASSTWAQSFPHSAPLAVENTATYRTLSAGPEDAPYPAAGFSNRSTPAASASVDSSTGAVPAYDADTELAEAVSADDTGSHHQYSAPAADQGRSEVTKPEFTRPEFTRPESTRPGARGGRAARRAAAAQRDAGQVSETGRPDPAARYGSASPPEYAPSTPFVAPAPYSDPIASPTGELELASEPNADLGDWAAATWDRLVANDPVREKQAPAAAADDPLSQPSGTYPGVSDPDRTSGSILEPEFDARTSGDLPGVKTSGVFTPPAEPTWTPPEEPVWGWPASEQPAPASAAWTPPQWDEGTSSPAAPTEQPGNVGSVPPYGRGTNGTAANGSGGLNGGAPLGGRSGLGGSYLEREYGGLGTPPRRAPETNGYGGEPPSSGAGAGWGSGRHGRAENPVSGQPAANNGFANPGGLGNPSGSGTPNGRGTSNGLGAPNGLGHPSGLGGLGAAPTGPSGLGGLGPASPAAGYGVPNPYGQNGAAARGPGGPGPGGSGVPGLGSAPRRRHAAEPTGTWPVHDPLGPGGGSWADPQPGPPPQPGQPHSGQQQPGQQLPPQREPGPAEQRGYRNGPPGENPERRDQPPVPRARRRYADEDSGRHGGTW